MTPFSIMILVGFFVLLGGFFAGSETALISLNRVKLRHLAESGNRNAQAIQKLLEDPDQVLITMLIGTNVALLLASSLFLEYLVRRGTPFAEGVATLVITPLFLLFGEIIPKALFRQRALFLMEGLAGPLKLSFRLLFPLAKVLRFLNEFLLRLLGQKTSSPQGLFVTKAELKYLIQESEQRGLLEARERSMIYRIFELGEKRVKKVMTPLERIVTLPTSATIAEMVGEARRSRFSWIPVYEKEPPHYVGLVSLFDVSYEENVDKPLAAFLRPLIFVSEEMAIDEALVTLQTQKSSMAIVENAEKEKVGLVTIEDLLNELVGGV
ncbi:MAG: HlyC/CorC family transporter [Candidatus Omnitrophica bacterium]|nr:HlyC/CorC family transporter [Candidatus Omnitrophota bacterium]